jgi:predicted RNA-binding protein Jag
MQNDDLELEVLQELDKLTDEELKVEADKYLAVKAKQAEYRKKAVATPEAMAKRKAYRVKKYAREKAVLARAKELGLV